MNALRMRGDPRRIRGGIELDDHERAAHHASQLAQHGTAIADVTDRGQAHRDIDRSIRERQRLTGSPHDQHSIDVPREVPARLDRDDLQGRMPRHRPGRERRRAGTEIE
jgi:hypothetical protein